MRRRGRESNTQQARINWTKEGRKEGRKVGFEEGWKDKSNEHNSTALSTGEVKHIA
jgi:hypothetical protein